MDKIQIYVRMKIHDAQLEDFKSVASKCLQMTRDKDRGALQYDWFLDEEGKECVIFEQYRDSNAVLQHMANLGDTLGELFSHAEADLVVCGDPSPELLKAGEGMNISLYRYMQGL